MSDLNLGYKHLEVIEVTDNFDFARAGWTQGQFSHQDPNGVVWVIDSFGYCQQYNFGRSIKRVVPKTYYCTINGVQHHLIKTGIGEFRVGGKVGHNNPLDVPDVPMPDVPTPNGPVRLWI
jgi:hypothetical protein